MSIRNKPAGIKVPLIKGTQYLILPLILLFLVFPILPAHADGSITLKLVVANPSKGQAQKVPLKSFLPREIKPEDVIDKDDLDIAYDTEQGVYYVYNTYNVKPGEFLEKDVELKDIWVISDSEIDSLRKEAEKMEQLLKDTEYYERVAFLRNGIDSKLNEITESQKNSPASAELHISNYRDNLRTLELVKQDLLMERSFLAQQNNGISHGVFWKLFLGVIIFLALFIAVFYFIWQRQLKFMAQDTFEKEETPNAPPHEGEGN
jgi:hypothetical protein